MMTPLPPILNIEIIFFDLCIYCLKSEALNWLSPGILARMVPPPTQPATKNGQVHGVMGFVKQGLVAEVTRASISRAIKLLGWDIDGCWHKYLPFETITFGICASFQPISNIVDVEHPAFLMAEVLYAAHCHCLGLPRRRVSWESMLLFL